MSSNNNNNNAEGQPPPAKRQRRSLGASDRVVLDVGGTKFITSASTLTSNSAYFASLLSDNWIEPDNGEDEIFIDQDPVPFKVLLAYMRRGVVMVDDINIDVLLLAEFLGIERLLLAIKVRWYCNIGRGPVHTTDDEIAEAFDQEHGGIMRAISSGLFQYFLKQNDVDAEKEFAMVRIISSEAPTPGAPLRLLYKLKEVGKSGTEHVIGAVHGALNGLHLKGYTHYENKLRTTKDIYTFSKRKHETMGSGATDIFIPNNDKRGQQRNNHVKQFAIVGTAENENRAAKMIGAPAEFDEDESVRSDPLRIAVLMDPDPSWLEDNGFVTREDEYEDIFREHLSSFVVTATRDSSANAKLILFSRLIVNERGNESW